MYFFKQIICNRKESDIYIVLCYRVHDRTWKQVNAAGTSVLLVNGCIDCACEN